jgi:hypothetical protein
MQEKKAPRPRKEGDTLVACHPDQYDDLLNVKVTNLSGMLQNAIKSSTATTSQQQHILPNIEVYSSPKTHFRMRYAFVSYDLMIAVYVV